MPYCPEDGSKMTKVHEGDDADCYDCPKCHKHYSYDDADMILEDGEESGKCEECEKKVK